MKMKSILVSMLAVAALVSCSKENDPAAGSELEAEQGKAYMAISITEPSALKSRADYDNLAPEISVMEDAVKSLSIVGFNATGAKVPGKDNGVYELTEAEIQAGKALFKISSNVKKIFVVANATPEMKDLLAATSNFSSFSNAPIETPLNWGVSDNVFPMTSEGLLDVQLFSTPEAAQLAPMAVPVYRTLSKVKFLNDKASVMNGLGGIQAFLTNTTNKSFYLYSSLVDLGSTKGIYRQDPNWTKLTMEKAPSGVISGSAIDAFNWVSNKTTNVWRGPGVYDYFYENTMAAAAQDYNNTTKIIIKGVFTPTAIQTLGTSWFRYAGSIMTFDQLKGVYTDAKAAGTNEIVNAFDSFAEKVMGVADTKFDALTLAGIDAREKGGYLAATAEPCMIQYFQKSVCYYDVNIKHDNTIGAGLLGRWGVVRNNSYTVDVKAISNPGLPFIPDPTDPDINDPSNPDPTDPTPNDDIDQNINVDIKVEAWKPWTQDENL